jgi:hypothetical protein
MPKIEGGTRSYCVTVAARGIALEPATTHFTELFEQANVTIHVGPPTEIAVIFVAPGDRTGTTMVMV